MSLITRNAKEYRSMTAQFVSQNQPIVSCSSGIFCVLRHPNHFLLAGANNRNVNMTYRFLAAPVQANLNFFYMDCMTVYFNCKYLLDTRELLVLTHNHNATSRSWGSDWLVINVMGGEGEFLILGLSCLESKYRHLSSLLCWNLTVLVDSLWIPSQKVDSLN